MRREREGEGRGRKQGKGGREEGERGWEKRDREGGGRGREDRERGKRQRGGGKTWKGLEWVGESSGEWVGSLLSGTWAPWRSSHTPHALDGTHLECAISFSTRVGQFKILVDFPASAMQAHGSEDARFQVLPVTCPHPPLRVWI